METGGGTDRAWSEVRNAACGRGTALGASGGGKGIVNGVELEEARFSPLSRANSSAMLVVMLVASWLTMPSSAAMRAWASKVGDVCTVCGEIHGGGAPEDVGGGRCIEGAPEYAGGMPAGVGGGGVCVGGG
ncbi:hypothetical protein CDL15_Pgr008064 [Punica granatum]|uniref:Uncharacterized protein n=1 Tax=Punica granatum TaxID=22663 RepID=A0A218WM48_PUNGR|nr:hypothetical protein CDL15_Pgr008064 [Punica granatum]